MQLKTFSLFISMAVFFIALALTLLFGNKAVPVSGSAFRYSIGIAKLKDKVSLLRACKPLYCAEFLSVQILKADPHNTDALGSLAISLCRRGFWKEAEPRFDQYFAEGGGAPDVQKWYQKLLSQQASLDKKL